MGVSRDVQMDVTQTLTTTLHHTTNDGTASCQVVTPFVMVIFFIVVTILMEINK